MSAKINGIVPDLWKRVARTRDFAAETSRLRDIAEVITIAPADVLDACVAVALQFCGGTSCGISLLEDGPNEQQQFRTVAIAGRMAHSFPARTARHFSPCAACDDAEETILLARPERTYPFLQSGPVIHEMLLSPLGSVAGRSRGALWVASHSPAPGFDAGDGRLLQAIAVLVVASLEVARAAKAAAAVDATQRLTFNELEHRVKNTLLMSATALGWEIANATDDRDRSALEGARRRLLAVAEMDRLTGIPEEVDVGAAIRALCASVAGAQAWLKVHVSTSEVMAPGPSAALMVLIVNELMTNAIKHGSPGESAVLTVGVTLAKAGPDSAVLAVTDDGAPYTPKAVAGSGKGLNLVHGLARQLGGTFAVDAAQKRFVVTFPINVSSVRAPVATPAVTRLHAR